MSSEKVLTIDDIFTFSGKHMSLKEGFDPSFATKLFVDKINKEAMTSVPSEIPVKELILQAATVTLGKIQDTITEFQVLINAIHEQLNVARQSEEPPPVQSVSTEI
jgi:hypothetical protein